MSAPPPATAPPARPGPTNPTGTVASRANPSPVLDLSKYADAAVDVKLAGGRRVRGILRGWDPLVNLVLDDAVELRRTEGDAYGVERGDGKAKGRKVGLVVVRGTSVMAISPLDGTEEIENPFAPQEEQ